MHCHARSMAIQSDRDVKSLLEKHAEGVVELRESLGPGLLSEPEHDDSWLLRFLLSHHASKAEAEAAIRQTLAWRKEKAELLLAACAGSPLPPRFDIFTKYVGAGIHGKTRDGDLIFIVRAGLANGKALLDALGPDLLLDFMLFNRERVYRQLIDETRRTGRICKVVAVTDLNFASLSRMSRAFTQLVTKASKLSEIYFPQYLDTAVVINVPTVMKTLIRTIWSFMPKKTQQKLRLCRGRTLTEDISKCPFAAARLSPDSVPSFLGGRCLCSQGCIGGLANDQRVANQGVDEETGLSKWSVTAKGQYEVFVDVKAGQAVRYMTSVEKGMMTSGPLHMSAKLRCSAGKEIVLLEGQPVVPDTGIVDGSVACSEDGTCVFVWKNNSSMFSRSMHYCVHVDEDHGVVGDGA